jgi:hypothetical protein
MWETRLFEESERNWETANPSSFAGLQYHSSEAALPIGSRDIPFGDVPVNDFSCCDEIWR